MNYRRANCRFLFDIPWKLFLAYFGFARCWLRVCLTVLGVLGVWVPEPSIYLAIKYASRVFLIFIINLKAHRASCKKAFNLIMFAINCRFIWPAWRVNARTPASLIKCPPRQWVYAMAEIQTQTQTHTHIQLQVRILEIHFVPGGS